MTTIPDSTARERILTAHDETLLVEAGAGSGKTALLAGRIALLLAAGVAARGIVAITFTEAAAAELFERIERYVQALADGTIPKEMALGLPHGLSVNQIQAIAQARNELDEITCTTIHGFCQQIIRPYPLETALDPGAGICDAQTAEMLRRDVLHQWLTTRLTVAPSPQTDALAAFAEIDVDATLRFLDVAARAIVEQRGIPEILPWPDAAAEILAAAINEFTFWYSEVGVFEEKTARDVDEFRAIITELEDIDAPPHAYTTLFRRLTLARPAAVVKEGPRFRLWRRKGAWNKAAKAVGLTGAIGEAFSSTGEELYMRCSAAYTDFIEAHAGFVFAAALREVEQFSAAYAAAKQARSLVDFDDLLVCARRLLIDHPDIRNSLSRRYERVLVDEFQDTDPVQAEILWYLCGDGTTEEPQSWDQRRIRRGSLFLVGDPKQAIYGFRGADIAIYQRAKAAICGDNPAALVQITANFRSHTHILAFVNDTFETLLHEARDQPGFVALDAIHPPTERDALMPPVGVIPVPRVGTETEPSDNAQPEPNGSGAEDTTPKKRRDIRALRVHEAQAVADFVAQGIGTIPIIDRRTGAVRPARAGDFALLAPRTSQLWLYENALEQRAIPIATQAGKNFYGRQEVQDVLALLRTLADPRDTYALGAVLRGPLVGMTEQELADLYLTWPADQEPFTILTDPADVAAGNVRRVLQQLQVLRSMSIVTTPYRTLAAIIDAFDLRALLRLRDPRAVERSFANLERLLSMATTYESRGFFAFVRALQNKWAERDPRESEGVPDAQENAVQILTVHASKGLEWPIVIPINAMTEASSGKPTPIYVDPVERTMVGKILEHSGTGYRLQKTASAARSEREYIRLWYVALTRARNHLFFPEMIEAKGTDIFSRLERDLGGVPQVMLAGISGEISRGVALTENTAPTTCRSWTDDEAALQNALVQFALERPSAHEGNSATTDGVNESLQGDFDELPIEPPAPQAITEMTGTMRGVLFHKLMEEVITGEIDDGLIAQRAVELLTQLDVPLSARATAGAELTELVRRVFGLPEIAAVAARLEAEVPSFALRLSAGRRTLTSAVMDAIVRGPDGTIETVFDWKTDRSIDSGTLAAYQRQLQTYLRDSGARTGYIVFAELGRCVAVTNPQEMELIPPVLAE